MPSAILAECWPSPDKAVAEGKLLLRCLSVGLQSSVNNTGAAFTKDVSIASDGNSLSILAVVVINTSA